MVFSSAIFLFAFLPIVLLVYFIIPNSFKNFTLFIFSLLFYAWGEGSLVLLLILSALVNYIIAIILTHINKSTVETHSKNNRKKCMLIMAIIYNISILVYYKYANFIVNDVAFILFNNFTINLSTIKAISLPIGISFYTFQALSYVIDVYSGDVNCTYSFINFGCYLTCFPQLIAGPIVRYKSIASELVHRSFTIDKFSQGAERFVWGMAKKVLIANTVATAADKIFNSPAQDLGIISSWLGAIWYTIQIYYDFSGYSDMAIGLGLMFGFTYCENFNHPYISKSIREFWQRWHMSLSTWFRDYLYIPLGGNRVSPWRIYLNLWSVFLLCGFWHGASWNFILWGAYYGIFLVWEKSYGNKLLSIMNRVIRHVYTMLIVVVGWVIFRAETIHHIKNYLLAMLGQAQNTVDISSFASPNVWTATFFGILFAMPVQAYLSDHFKNAIFASGRFLALLLVFVTSITSISSGVYNPFLYFRF